MANKKKAKTIRKYNINQPSQLKSMATVLKNHVVKNKLYTNIRGKNYAHVEGWQFAGGLLGIYPEVTEVKDLSKEFTDGEVKWMAEVEIKDKKTGKTVGKGYAICSDREANKKGFEEYAILSMAQTRAIGKAYRNLLGWVMKLAGYESTPAEEISDEGGPNQKYIKAVEMVDNSKSKDQLKKWKKKLESNKEGEKELYGEKNYESLLKRINGRLA